MDAPQPPRLSRPVVRTAIGTVAGASIGLLVSVAAYTWLNPVLEARDDWLRELQGFLFSTIPAAALAGGAVGALVQRRWSQRN